MTENTENTENNEKVSVDISTVLNVTRQKLVTATLVNTELEALVLELKSRIAELEKNI